MDFTHRYHHSLTPNYSFPHSRSHAHLDAYTARHTKFHTNLSSHTYTHTRARAHARMHTNTHTNTNVIYGINQINNVKVFSQCHFGNKYKDSVNNAARQLIMLISFLIISQNLATQKCRCINIQREALSRLANATA